MAKGIAITNEPYILELVGEEWLGAFPELMDTRHPLGKALDTFLRFYPIQLAIRIGLGGKRLFELAMKAVGPLFIVICMSLYACVAWIYINSINPYAREPHSVMGWVHILISSFVFQGGFFNYFMAISTPPGSPSPSEGDAEEVADMDISTRRKKFCQECKTIKVPRSHHCYVCGRCVFRMDHHCPWIGNCVGHMNHRYFYLFLFYLALSCIYCGFMTFFPFMYGTDYSVPWQGISAKGTVVFVFVLCIAVLFAVGMMFLWHTYLVMTAQTTVEFYMNRYEQQQRLLKGTGDKALNRYDLGLVKNLSFFFGPNRFLLGFLLPTIVPPPGDGRTYPTQRNPKW